MKNGEQVSKKRASTWASKEFPQWASLIDEATTWREKQWNKVQINVESYLPKGTEFVNFMIDQILKKWK